MKELYLKYIQENTAPLEVNISSRKRRNIEAEFGKEVGIDSIEGILNVMELAVEEVVQLLTGAAMRFSAQQSRASALLALTLYSPTNQVRVESE